MSGEGSEIEVKQLDENALLVQHDWFNCIRNTQTDSEFFVGIREYGSPSTFIDVKQKSGKLFTAAPQKVHVEKLDARRLTVAYSDKAMAKSTFIAPRIEFTTVHESSVQSVDVSGTGRLVVSSDLNGKLVVWNADTAEIVRDFVGHALDVNRCRFFPSGLVVLSAGIDMTLRIWSVETGQCPRTLKGHTQSVVDVGIIERGKEVLSCSKDGTAKMWNCGSAECLRTWHPEAGHVNALAISPSSSSSGTNMFGVACESGKANVYDLRSNDSGILVVVPGENCTAITFCGIASTDSASEDANLYIGTEEGSIIGYSMKAGKVISKLRTSRGAVTRLSAQQPYGLFASFHDGTVCCYDLPMESSTAKLEFSGADCDPVYDISTAVKGQLFTASRDRIVRKYCL